MSTASWAPPKRGNPSATTSNRRASACIRFREVKVSHKDVGGDSPATFPANPSNHAFQRITSPPQNPDPRAGCTVVATRVEWKATGSDARLREEGGASGAGAVLERAEAQSTSRGTMGMWSKPDLHQVRPGTAKAPVQCHPTWRNSSTSLNLCSVREAASCCQQPRSAPRFRFFRWAGLRALSIGQGCP